MVKWFLVQINLMAHPKTRNTLYVEQAKLISQDIYDNTTIEILYKAQGEGTNALSKKRLEMKLI